MSRNRPRLRGLRASVSLLVALVGGACVGTIGDGDGDVGGAGAGGPGPRGDDVGRVTLHRLNRVEYDNTVRDLIGTSQRLAESFPADDHAFGFDNMADALVLSPLQLELYERAAETLTTEIFRVAVPSTIARAEAETLTGTVGQATPEAWLLWSNGDVSWSTQLAAPGTYRLRVRAWQSAAGPDPARMTITWGGQSFGPFDIAGEATSPVVVEQEVEATGTNAIVLVSFVNDFYEPTNQLDRNLFVDWIEIEGPIGAQADNPLYDRLVVCDPASEGEPCVRSILEGFGRRAFRRPLASDEVDRLLALYDAGLAEGDAPRDALALVIQAILVSPHFLFRVELDPDPTSLEGHPLTDFELASRLSYFLWSSMPDDELLAAAEAGQLHDAATLTAQVERMLDDPRASALVENFAGQWLYLRALADKTPNYGAFPDFDEPLRAAMRDEANRAFADLLAPDAPPLDALVRRDRTYLNDRLADHYELPAGLGDELQPVALETDRRGGLLRQGAWLTVTSNPDRTSPVKRGKWILENLLCDAPPPPPPGVEGFKPADLEAKSQKELLEAHRADPACASCHATMDPLGLALENFDGIGAWREVDHGTPVDPAGTFGDEPFTSQAEFVEHLVDDPRFSLCAVEKTMTYALGRGLDAADAPYLSELDAALRSGPYTLRQLVVDVVQSEPFRFRRGEEEAP